MKLVDLSELEERERLETPLYPARACWHFDRNEILRAMDYLQIEMPVRIRYSAGRSLVGTHYAREGYHRIVISQDRNITDSNNTLWHELTHAHQSEEFARTACKSIREFYRAAYKPAKGPYGASYVENKYEIEARQMAKQWEVNWQLLKST